MTNAVTVHLVVITSYLESAAKVRGPLFMSLILLMYQLADCGCSAASVTQQCNENGTCMCIEGAVGEKCSECGFEYSGML